MPSAFDSLFAAVARPQLMAQHGQSATYTNSAGASSAVTAILGEQSEQLVEEPDGSYRIRSWPMEFSSAEVASPTYKDKVTISGEVWPVRVIERCPGGRVAVVAVRRELVEAGPDGFRRIRR